jgi:predicted Fe-Mo cluster-binding NifX family protein
MIIAVTSTASGLDAQVDPRFGRCQYFTIIDTETMQFETIDNDSMNKEGGAGIQAARTIADKGAETVLTGNCGPNAHRTLSAAGIKVIIGCTGTVSQAVQAFNAGTLEAATSPNVEAHHATVAFQSPASMEDGQAR